MEDKPNEDCNQFPGPADNINCGSPRVMNKSHTTECTELPKPKIILTRTESYDALIGIDKDLADLPKKFDGHHHAMVGGNTGVGGNVNRRRSKNSKEVLQNLHSLSPARVTGKRIDPNIQFADLVKGNNKEGN